jgi:type II secretory pathway predicted ATPase ExeA
MSLIRSEKPTSDSGGEEMQNNNFLNFFGLRETPFNVNLDPRFLFVTPQLEKAFSELMDGIHNGNCFAVITGEVGTGKTTLMHRLRRRLMHQGVPTAFLFYTHLNRTHLLDFILTDFGIPCNSGETIDDWKRLENWLVERHCGGQTPVLLVDEAQGLPPSAFEEIRMLLNLETPREKLLQVVLAGELELEEKLKRVQMRELQQRITARCKTATLNRDETFDYVRNRLQVGGAKDQPLFQPDAMDAIYFYSRGIPRVINVLCEQALINACAGQVHVVTPHLIQEVARAFQWENAGHLPATESPASLATVDSAPVPRIAAPALPLMAGQAVLDEQPAVSPILASTEAPEMGSEALLKKRSRSPIPDPPAIRVQQSPENIAMGTLGQRLIALSARGEEKGQSAELTNSSARHLLAEFIQELENQKQCSHSAVRANIRGRETGQYAPRPLAVKINNRRAGLPRRAASPFWAWWFYGPRSGWWKEIGAVVNLPRWRHQCASLQRWLKEPVRPFQRELPNSHSDNAKRSLTEKSM